MVTFSAAQERRLCPACLSSVDAGADVCPQCGTSLRRRRRRWALWLVAVAGLAAAGWWLWPKPPAAEAATTTARVAAAAPAVPEAAERSGIVAVFDVGGQAHLAVAVASGGRTGLLLGLSDVPAEGGLETRGGRQLAVLGFDDVAAVALLTADPDAEPLPLATTIPATGARLAARAVAGTTSVTVVLAGARQLVVQPAPPSGSVIVDPSGAVVGWVFGTSAAPAWPARAWLTAAPRPLAELQQLLRWGFDRELAGAAAEVETATGGDSLRSALANLESIAARTTDPTRRARADALAQTQALRLVRDLAAADPERALDEAQSILRRQPGNDPLLAEAVRIATAVAPEEALTLLLELRNRSQERAAALEEPTLQAMLRTVSERLDGGDEMAAESLLQRLLELFPGRADVYALRAVLLEQSGRLVEAVAAANLAAQLDPDHAALLRRLQQRAATAESRVEIPLDPRSMSIRATVTVGGLPAELVVDTGATLTTIPTALSQRLGLTQHGTARVETAGGIVEAPVVEIPELTVGPIRARSVRAVVIDLPGSMAGKGLLGLNVLRQLDVHLDRERGVLVLQRDAGR